MSHKKVISFTCKKEKTLNFHKGLFSKSYRPKRSKCFKSVFSDLRFKVLFSECFSITNVKHQKNKKETKICLLFFKKITNLTRFYDNNASSSSSDRPVTSDTTSRDRPFESILRINSKRSS